MGQPGTQRCVTELSGNGTTPRHATKTEVKNYYWFPKNVPFTFVINNQNPTTSSGLPRGSLWDP
jgi:hypothetical protein